MRVRTSVSALCLAAALTILVLLGLIALQRPGYSPDEEITAAVVASIADTGLPLLPSGVLYNRGFPFSYLAWLTSRFHADAIASSRVASLAAGAAGLVIAHRLALASAGSAHAAVVVLLLATFPAYVAASAFARPYSMLVACSMLALAAFGRRLAGHRGAWLFLAMVACANALHPLGLALAALPFVYAAGAQRTPPIGLVRLGMQAAAVAVVTQAASYGAHWRSLVDTATVVTAQTAVYAIPTPKWPSTYVTQFATPVGWALGAAWFASLALLLARGGRRLDRSFLALCASLALSFQLGMLVLLAATSAVLTPAGGWRRVFCTACFFLAAVAWWSVHTALRTDAQFSPTLVVSLAQASLAYPLGALRYTAASLPAVTILGVCGIAIAAREAPSSTSWALRSIAVLAVVILAGFDILGIPLAERYLLLPWTLALLIAGYGIVGGTQLVAGTALGQSGFGRGLVWAFAIGSCSWILLDHFRYGERRLERGVPVPLTRAMVAPVTGASWEPARFQGMVEPADTVICTEELACLHLFGRVDVQLSLTPADIAHYVVNRRGESRGFYADSPVITTTAGLAELIGQPSRPGCHVVASLNTGKVAFAAHREAVATVARSLDGRVLLDNPESYVVRVCMRDDPFRGP